MDYEKLMKEFRIDVPGHFNFAFDVIDRRADENRNRLAMIWLNEQNECRKLTFWDFKVYSNKAANFLKSYDIKKGDRILVMLPRIPEWWFIILGIMKLGAVFVPSAVSLTSKDLEYRCNAGNIKMVITDPENAPKIEEIKGRIPTVANLVMVGPERKGWIDFLSEMEPASRHFVSLADKKPTLVTDPLLIYFTSGTTGYPKIVMHRHSYPLAHRITAELWHGDKKNDIHWTITDTGWAKLAWGSLFGQWLAGCTIFIYDYRGRFNAHRILQIIEDYGITRFCAPPTAYRMLILEDLKKYDLSDLKHCVSAGEPLNPEVIETWKAGTGMDIYEGYGQTETVCLVATLPGMKIKYGSMGRPMPTLNVEIINDEQKPCKDNEEGDLAIKVKPVLPTGVFEGYLGDDDTNRDCFVGDWYLTGDRAYRDADGYYWFVGRRDDVIKSSGYRIGPFEVESALIEHPAVVEAAVVGVPDELRGQIVKAFVILASDYQPSDALAREIQEHVKHVTAPFKAPREIEFVKDLPKTISGKIRRVELREREIAKQNKP